MTKQFKKWKAATLLASFLSLNAFSGQASAEHLEKKNGPQNVLLKNLEDRISFYSAHESPAIDLGKHGEISLNSSYEREKKAEVQNILGKAGMLAERGEYGCFDEITTEALKNFQKKNKIKPDAVVGPNTARALNKIAKFELGTNQSILAPDGTCVLSIDDMRLVEDVQAALDFHNYLTKEPDGLLEEETVKAIRSYKRRNTLPNPNTIDKALIMHLSTSSSERLKLLKEAKKEMEKIKPETKNNIYINLPEFRMRFFRDNKMELAMDIVIGSILKKGRWKTNLQHGKIKYTEINPWWFIPQGDMTNEVREQLRSSSRLRNLMEQYVKGKWELIGGSKSYGSGSRQRFRQRPGPLNPLGRIAYSFGSEEMLHGTLYHKLFLSNYRAFSHGCIRLQDEAELFKTFQGLGVINKDINLEELIAQKDSKGIYKTRNVKLITPVGVDVVYLRAFAEEGEYGIYMTMPRDVYNYKQSRVREEKVGEGKVRE